MSIDLKLDLTSNDIIYKDGKFIPLDNTLEEARQRIQVRLRSWTNDWFLDSTFGLPYKDQILKKNVKKADIDTLVIEAINEVDLVNSISSFSSIILGRSYIVRFSANVTADSIDNIRGSDYQEWDYGSGGEEVPVIPCLDSPETEPTSFNINLVYSMGL